MEQHIPPLYCTDHRWLFFLNLSVVPQYNQSRTKIACTDFTACYQAVNFINNVRACFTMELRDLDMEDVSRDSVQKNSLSDPSNFNVLAQDQQFVLKVLDKAITKGNIGPELWLCILCGPFLDNVLPKKPWTPGLGCLGGHIRDSACVCPCHMLPGAQHKQHWQTDAYSMVQGGTGGGSWWTGVSLPMPQFWSVCQLPEQSGWQATGCGVLWGRVPRKPELHSGVRRFPHTPTWATTTNIQWVGWSPCVAWCTGMSTLPWTTVHRNTWHTWLTWRIKCQSPWPAV